VGAWRRRAWFVYLAVGVAYAVAYLVLPRHSLISSVLDDGGGFACAAAIMVGVRIHRPARRAPWYLFAAAQACSGCGDVLWTVYAEILHLDPFPSTADVLYLASYPLFTLGLFLLIRGRTSGRDVAGLLDASIIASGLGLLSWTFLMQPIAADDALSPVETLVSLAYPVADVLLIAMLARLITTPGARTRSYQLLTLGLLLVLGADVAYAVLNALSSYDGGLPDAGYMLSYACWGAAALHPTMRAVSEVAPSAPPRFTFRRFALLGLTTLIVPGVLIEEGVTAPGSIDWRGVSAGALVLFVLILARIWNLVRRVQDQASRLEAVAHSDALTGAANRRTWDLVLPQAMAAATRSGAEVAVAILDLDHFKRFNDRLGHQAGDRLLAEASARWQSLLRAGDLFARYGGEEFCVLLTGCTAEEGAATLERFKVATPYGQTFSAGLAMWDRLETPEHLLGRADGALYQAKHGGRNRIVLAEARSAGPPAARRPAEAETVSSPRSHTAGSTPGSTS
jgi:diguanylate cyclase (GGDEF)-like protein